MAWATEVDARAHWADAQSLDSAVLDALLEAAHEQCVAFAPALAATDPVPTRYMLANVYQARELAAAAQRGEQDVIGVGDYAIRARPLTAAVKQLLRPRKGIGAIG